MCVVQYDGASQASGAVKPLVNGPRLAAAAQPGQPRISCFRQSWNSLTGAEAREVISPLDLRPWQTNKPSRRRATSREWRRASGEARWRLK